MSNLSKKALRVVATLTAITTILSLSGFAVLAPVANAAMPSDYGLTEGNTISAAGSSDPDIYIVNEQGYKRLFLNPVIFSFYGHLGGFANVKTVSAVARDAFPTSGLFRLDGDQKVYGLESTGEDTAVLHWVNTTGAQAVADDPNFFKKVFVINQNEFNWYQKGSDYTSVNQIPVYTRGGSVQPGTGLSASLSYDNPAAGTVIETQALANMASFNVTGSGLVTSVELNRIGTSGDSTMSAVYLFVNGMRVSDDGSVSSGVINFTNGSGLFTAPATVQVRANIADSHSGETVGVKLTKLNSNVVSVSGNLMNVAANSTLAGVAVGAPTGPGDFNPTTEVAVWQSVLTITNEDVYLKRLTLREVGSIDNKDVKNLKLFAAGVEIASATGLDADGYVTFLANARLLTGARTLKVVADVVGGSTRTMQFSLKGAYDLEVVDESYMVGVVPSGTFAASPTASTLGSPSVTVIKAPTSPSSDVVNDAKDVSLAKYTMTGYGEAIKIETLAFKASLTNTTGGGTQDGLDNGRILINDQQYGSTKDLLTTYTDYTVNYTLQPGTPVTIELRADIQDSTGNEIDATDKVQIYFGDVADNNHGQGVSSAAQVDVPASADITANLITVATGSMSLTKYGAYANQRTTVPVTNFKLGAYVLSGSASEEININTINVDFDVANALTAALVKDVYVKFGNNVTSTKSTISATASNSWSVSYVLPKTGSTGSTVNVEVWGSIDTFTAADLNDTLITNMDISGTTANSAATATAAETVGQTITGATGTFAASVSGDTPSPQMVYAGQTATAALFNFAGTNDTNTINDLKFKVSGATANSVVSSVRLKDGTTTWEAPIQLVASGSYYAIFNSINLPVAPGTDGKTLTVDLVLGSVGDNAATSSANAAVSLAYWKYTPASSGTPTESYIDYDGNAVYVHRSLAKVSPVALPTTTLAAGEQTLSRFSVVGQGNTIGWKNMTFTMTLPEALKITSSSYKLMEDNVDISSSVASFTEADTATGKTVVLSFTAERQVGYTTPKVYELRATLGGTVSGSFVTQITKPTAYAVPNTATLATGTFTWTDRSAVSHSLTTADWMNDNLVKDLPISQAMNSI